VELELSDDERKLMDASAEAVREVVGAYERIREEQNA
jgi:hypothetical protein